MAFVLIIVVVGAGTLVFWEERRADLLADPAGMARTLRESAALVTEHLTAGLSPATSDPERAGVALPEPRTVVPHGSTFKPATHAATRIPVAAIPATVTLVSITPPSATPQPSSTATGTSPGAALAPTLQRMTTPVAETPEPSPTRTPTPKPTPVERFSRDYLETNILRLINDFRVAKGRSALRVDDRLAEIALGHSRDMAQHHRYSHINPRGEDPTARARRAGYDCNNPRSIGIAENIHVLYGHTSSLGLSYQWETQETMARRFAADFIGSPGHRQIILDTRYGLTGVGVAFGSFNGIAHAIFVTHNFC